MSYNEIITRAILIISWHDIKISYSDKMNSEEFSYSDNIVFRYRNVALRKNNSSWIYVIVKRKINLENRYIILCNDLNQFDNQDVIKMMM